MSDPNANATSTPLPPHVLVGVDGSDDGMRAVLYARREAGVQDQDLRIVHAVDDAILAGAWGVVYDPTILQQAGNAAVEEAVRVAVDDGFPAERIHAEVLMGNPAAVLARLSSEAGTMVVGRRSASRLGRMVLGSTSVGVASAAKCPVITISKAVNPEMTGGIGRIGVGVDTTKHSLRPLEWAFAEANTRKAGLLVMHVNQDEATGLLALLRPTPEQTQQHIDIARQKLAEMIAPLQERYPAVQVSSDVLTGNAVDALVNTSQELDLLALGVHAGGFGGSLGGVVRGVLAHALSPVAIIH